MPIYYNEDSKEFHLQSEKIRYIINILKNNQLGHLYFGKKLRHRDSFSHLYTSEAKANVACVFEGDLSFSLDTSKQEYPAYGTTDFREPAFQVLQENGSRVTNFVYKNHKIYSGKPKLEGLPATYVEQENEASTLEISLYDDLIDAELILYYSIFEQFSAITRSVKFVNHGKGNINLTRAM